MKTLPYPLIMLLASIIFTGCQPTKPVVKQENTISVKIISAAEFQGNEEIETSGMLSSEQLSNLSFEKSGIINKIFVKEGESVRKGQVLATLNRTEVDSQLDQAEENLNRAKRDAQRTANLYKDSVNTKEQYEHTQTELLIAKKQLVIAQYSAAQSTIRANTNGVVLKKSANEGEQVSGGSPVISISSIAEKDWVIKCGITDKDRARLTGQENAEIHFDVFPETLTGKVKRIAQGSDVGSGLYQVEIRLVASKAKLISGLFAKVKIFPYGKSELLSVPFDALVEGKNDSAYVYVTSGNKAFRKAVKVAYLKGSKAFVSSGISATDQVIREGSAYLTDGSIVKIVK
jgi:RND family efflux transporter MFP subunit